MDKVIVSICFVLSADGDDGDDDGDVDDDVDDDDDGDDDDDDDDDDDTNKNDIGLKFSLMLEGQLDA